MALIQFHHVSYAYPLREAPALQDVSLAIEAGERLLVVGESGAGKSTLLRALNGLVPHFYGGCFSGHVVVNGLDTRAVEPRDLSAHVGFVFQDPEAQFVADRVEDELVFAMENFGVPRATMQQRVEQVLAQLGIEPLRHRRIATLSGGEKQRVAIASVLTLQPRVLVLDEPTSQLDPQAAEEVLGALERLNRELGLTLVLAEHRLERVAPHVDRVLWLPGGGEPPAIGPTRAMLRELPLAPPIVELGRRLGWEPTPLTVQEGRAFVGSGGVGERGNVGTLERGSGGAGTRGSRGAGGAAIEVAGLRFAYGGRVALRDVTLTVGRGEFVAIMGRNGSGKSTLLKQLIGLLRPDAGTVRLLGESIAGRAVQAIAQRVGYVPQNPNALLFAETVYEELLVTLRNHGLDEGRAPVAPRALLARLGLTPVAGQYPRDLSAGQRERVALAAVLVTRPPLLLLDEPTRGLDYHQKASLMAQLQQWQQEGATVVVVSHDVELIAQVATRVVLLADGAVVADGPPRVVLPASPFAPQMARLVEGEAWLTVADAVAGLGGRRKDE